MKIIVAGGRNFDDYKLLCKVLKSFKNISEIVSGGARGADKLGEKYATFNNINVKIFLAEWDKYGKRAGFLRNIQMGQYANVLVAFWDGQSKGTEHMIKTAQKLGLIVHIVRYQKESMDW